MAVSIVLIGPGDQAIITSDWSDAIGSNTLGAVTHTVPSPLTKLTEATDASLKLAQVKVSGAVHGGTYYISGQSTLSNGEVINRTDTVRCFNA